MTHGLKARAGAAAVAGAALAVLLVLLLLPAPSPATTFRQEAPARALPASVADGYTIDSIDWDLAPRFTRHPAVYKRGARAKVAYALSSSGTDDYGDPYDGSVTCNVYVAVTRNGKFLSGATLSADTNIDPGYCYVVHFKCPSKAGRYVFLLRAEHPDSGCQTDIAALRFRVR